MDVIVTSFLLAILFFEKPDESIFFSDEEFDYDK